MKQLAFIIILLVAGQMALAAPVGVSQARQTASQFIGRQPGMARRAPAKNVLSLAYTAAKDNDNFFYVFNQQGGGFVIVAADDQVPAILGYSVTGAFDVNRMPQNMHNWLEGYQRQMAVVVEGSHHAAMRQSASTTTAIEPLLGDIAWDQTDPYNRYCPTYDGDERSATGCVAVSMGQVMRHHQWPERGIGSHTYYDGDGCEQTLTANFDSTAYQWDKMLPTLTAESPEESIDAVATLLFHLGVSVDMQYGSSSGALSTNIAPALAHYFNYDRSVHLLFRDYFSTNEWEKMLMGELRQGRPVIYEGTTYAYEGHSFVIDGCDAQGYYHVNWGWSGESNGYFLLNVLDPETQGTGGSSDALAFRYDQDMIIGIQPAVEGSEMVYSLTCDGIGCDEKAVERSEELPLTTDEIDNYSIDTARVMVDFIVTDSLDHVVAASSSEPMELAAGKYSYGEERTLAVPDSVAPGNYTIRLAFRPIDDTNYQRLPIYNTSKQSFPLRVTTDSLIIEDNTAVDLKLVDLTFAPDTLLEGKESVIKATFRNDGGYFGYRLYFTLKKSNGKGDTFKSGREGLQIATGETATVNFYQKIDLPAGDYVMHFFARDEDYNDIDLHIDTLVTIVDPTVTSIRLSKAAVPSDKTVYDLSGRRQDALALPRHGIYVVDGKKIMKR